MKTYSREELSQSFRNLGVVPGDTLMVRANLGAIGRISSRKRTDYIGSILDVLGPEGTLIGLAFTGCTSSARGLKKKPVFDGTNPSYTGAFTNTMLSYSDAFRSSHPSNSYVGIGLKSKEMLAKHDETSGAYEPVRDIMENNGKMLLIGCAGSSPGFTTTHLAEVDLGLHRRIVFPQRFRCRYVKDGEVKLFKRPDLGSCSSSFYRMYGLYVKAEILDQGCIGNAYSLIVDARAAYDVDREELLKNPRATICNDSLCGFCNRRRWDNLHKYPQYLVRRVVRKIKKEIACRGFSPTQPDSAGR